MRAFVSIDGSLLARVTGGAAPSDKLHTQMSGLTQQINALTAQATKQATDQAQVTQALSMAGQKKGKGSHDA
ncbi:MAG TPA: hypothetical protein VGM88_23805 [Kofleriaceae bacterium]|jgi:hypothetical protein